MIASSNDKFTGSIGVLLAAVGSAIGLGNIWKFPYITGHYGGSAFIIIYLICIALVGLPVILSEFVIGRSTGKDAVGAFKELAPGTAWVASGWLSVLVSFLITSFYSIIAGWTLFYAVESAIGGFDGLNPTQIGDRFGAFYTSSWQPVIWQIVFMAIAAFIVIKGIKNGIEKYSKILMPLLLLILIVLCIRSVTLEGSAAGLDFLFKPDFSKVTAEGVFSALGHAFFTLSIGMAIMVTYASYVRKEERLGSLVVKIAIADTVIALLAGIAIFPAVFAFNIEPSAGPGLVFVTLPNVFNQMPFGNLFAFLFFFLLATAALTSAISLLEPNVAYLMNGLNWGRKKATIIVSISITVLGAILTQGNGILSEFKLPFYLGGKVAHLNIFDWLITLTDQVLPISGLFIAIFVGWVVKRKVIDSELNNAGFIPYFMFVIRFIAPVLILLVLISNLFGLTG